MRRSDFLKSLAAIPFLGKAIVRDRGAALPAGDYIPVPDPPSCLQCGGEGKVVALVNNPPGVLYAEGYLPLPTGPWYEELPCPSCRPGAPPGHSILAETRIPEDLESGDIFEMWFKHEREEE